MTIEELLSRHFRVRTTDVFAERSEDPGRAVSLSDALEFCKNLTPRQRETLDPGVLDGIDALFTEAAARFGSGNFRYSGFAKLKRLDWWKGQRSPDVERSWTTSAVLYGMLNNCREIDTAFNKHNLPLWWALRELISERLAKRPLRLDVKQVLVSLESGREDRDGTIGYEYALISPAMKSAVQLSPAEVRVSAEDASLFRDVRRQLVADGYGASSRREAAWISEVLGEGDEDLLCPIESWAEEINVSIRSMPKPTRASALKLLKHAGTSAEYSAKPAKAWFASAQEIINEIGSGTACDMISSWLRTFASDSRIALAENEEEWARYDARLRTNTGYIAGLVHLTRCLMADALFPVLCDVVEHVANARHAARRVLLPVAMAALRSMEASTETLAAVHLSRVALRLRWPKLRKAAEKALDACIARSGLSRGDVEEAAVPDFGIADGVVKIGISDGHAEITVRGAGQPRLTWFRPGKPATYSVPRALKNSNAAEIACIRSTADEIGKMLAAQRTRIDLLFRREAAWPYELWRQRYLDHGLLGTLSRRLIWLVDDVPLLHWQAVWQDVEGREFNAASSSRVALWHPALRSAEEVLAWRQRLENLEVTQPIKQAHREVYLLTDAERRTRTYSNRFAAHIVRNHVTLAVSQARKWKMGMYGGGTSTPTLALPHWELRAEWWVQATAEDRDRMGFPIYLVTDQVRLYRGDDQEPMGLEEVPLLAFSEVMRDVDLFVGVASVGNDPTWQDGGPQGRYRDYWQNYSFGELSATARTRREVLETLLPRLSKIREQCSLEERFLIVRGQLRTYKIHLGSGNILMAPNDEYLCIVPDRSSKGDSNVFLPFEGDSTLSIILSKAFLLAEDTKIKDPTITRQIRGH